MLTMLKNPNGEPAVPEIETDWEKKYKDVAPYSADIFDYECKKIKDPDQHKYRSLILQVFVDMLHEDEHEPRVLEIASGSGEMVIYYASHRKKTIWQPTEVDPACLDSIEYYVDLAKLPNVRPPVMVDVTKKLSEWPKEIAEPGSWDAILCTNLIHVSPWSTTVALFSAAEELLKPGGYLCTMDPYMKNGIINRPGNVKLERKLKRINPEWGLKDLIELEELGNDHNMEHHKELGMMTHNKFLMFKKLG